MIPPIGSIENRLHHITYRIYYEDTDAGGIVYHANYLRFAERARTEMLRVLQINQSELRERQGIGFVVRHCEIDFMAPARLDDIVTVETEVAEMGRSRFILHQHLKKGNQPLALVKVVIVTIDKSFRPTRIPDTVRVAFESVHRE
jgi:acyl-CoA thioester hydrolase